MYPQPPPTHRPTNYYWVLVVCVVAMLGLLFVTLKSMAGRFSDVVSQTALAPAASTAPARIQISAAPSASPQAAASPEAVPAASATPPGGIIDVDPKTLTESPGTYRSRPVRVRGTVFYTGKVDGGKTWIQIVDNNNVYVDGQLADALPQGVAKGVEVEITGIGAGLYTITASNGKDYDQAYVDPIDKIEVVGH